VVTSHLRRYNRPPKCQRVGGYSREGKKKLNAKRRVPPRVRPCPAVLEQVARGGESHKRERRSDVSEQRQPIWPSGERIAGPGMKNRAVVSNEVLVEASRGVPQFLKVVPATVARWAFQGPRQVRRPLARTGRD